MAKEKLKSEEKIELVKLNTRYSPDQNGSSVEIFDSTTNDEGGKPANIVKVINNTGGSIAELISTSAMDLKLIVESFGPFGEDLEKAKGPLEAKTEYDSFKNSIELFRKDYLSYMDILLIKADKEVTNISYNDVQYNGNTYKGFRIKSMNDITMIMTLYAIVYKALAIQHEKEFVDNMVALQSFLPEKLPN